MTAATGRAGVGLALVWVVVVASLVTGVGAVVADDHPVQGGHARVTEAVPVTAAPGTNGTVDATVTTNETTSVDGNETIENVTDATGTVGDPTADVTNATRTESGPTVGTNETLDAGILAGATSTRTQSTTGTSTTRATRTGTTTGTTAGNATGDADDPSDSVEAAVARGRLFGTTRGPRPSPAPTAGAVAVGTGTVALAALTRRLAGPSLPMSADAVSSATWRAALRRLRAGVGSRWRRRVTRVLGAVGYSRYDDSDPLTHEGRADIFEFVAARPGVYASRVADRTGTPLSTVRYHLDVLEAEGLLDCATVRGKRRYFPADTERKDLVAALDDEPHASILSFLADRGEMTGTDLAAALDRSESTVTHHLTELADAGLVVRETRGRAVVNRLSPDVEAVLGDGATDPAVDD